MLPWQIPRQHRAAVWMTGAHLPFSHGHSPQGAWRAAVVAQLNMHKLDGGISVSKKSGLDIELIGPRAKHAVALAMLYPMFYQRVASRALLVARSQMQQLSGLNVLQLVMLMRWVLHSVIAPRRDLMLATVDSPGVATASFRHLKPKRRIGNDIDPWARRPLRWADAELKLA